MLVYNNLNIFYWLIVVFSLINFTIYLLSGINYKYKNEDEELLKTVSISTSVAMVGTSKDELPKIYNSR